MSKSSNSASVKFAVTPFRLVCGSIYTTLNYRPCKYIYLSNVLTAFTRYYLQMPIKTVLSHATERIMPMLMLIPFSFENAVAEIVYKGCYDKNFKICLILDKLKIISFYRKVYIQT